MKSIYREAGNVAPLLHAVEALQAADVLPELLQALPVVAQGALQLQQLLHLVRQQGWKEGTD